MCRETVCAWLPSWFSREVSHPSLTRLDPMEWMRCDRRSRGWNGCAELTRLFQLRLRARRSARLLLPTTQLQKCQSTVEPAFQSSGTKGVFPNKKIFIANLKLSQLRALTTFTIIARTGVTIMELLMPEDRMSHQQGAAPIHC